MARPQCDTLHVLSFFYVFCFCLVVEEHNKKEEKRNGDGKKSLNAWLYVL
jgi:hypothetical protein